MLEGKKGLGVMAVDKSDVPLMPFVVGLGVIGFYYYRCWRKNAGQPSP
jgi:hypothetical protein